MTHSLALVRIGRWMLPWVAILFVSGTLAYAVNGAIAGDYSAGDQRRDVQVAVPTGEGTGPATVERSLTSSSGESADLGPTITPERCAPIGSGYMDSSIVAESRKIDCGWAP